MTTHMHPGLPFLFDDSTENMVGLKQPNGAEKLILGPMSDGGTDPTSLAAHALEHAGMGIGLTSRIRASLAARPRNPFTAAPWIASPAWVGSTAYALTGQQVTNGGKQYHLQTPGTSASSGGPTGTGAGPIADGTCVWYYAGPARAASAYPAAPSISWTSAAGAGLSTSVPYNTSGAFFFSGGAPTFVTVGYRFPVANTAPSVGSATGTYNAVNPTVTFNSDAPKILISGLGPAYNNVPLQIEVDGQFIQLGSLAPASTVNPGGLLIDWSGERKPRRYRVWAAPNGYFTGVHIDSASTVWAEKNTNRFRLVVNGDSMSAGANQIPYLGQSWPDQLGYLIGCDDIYNCAVGGTGFIANNSGTSTTFAQRLPDVIGFAPDVHVVAGNVNDGSASSAVRQAAILSYLQTYIAALPKSRVLVFGPVAGAGAASAFTAQEADLAAVVSQMNDSRISYLPVSADTPPWIDGTGNVSATTGAGNADVLRYPDGTHPTQTGVNYLAQRYSAAWGKYWSAQA